MDIKQLIPCIGKSPDFGMREHDEGSSGIGEWLLATVNPDQLGVHVAVEDEVDEIRLR